MIHVCQGLAGLTPRIKLWDTGAITVTDRDSTLYCLTGAEAAEPARLLRACLTEQERERVAEWICTAIRMAPWRDTPSTIDAPGEGS